MKKKNNYKHAVSHLFMFWHVYVLVFYDLKTYKHANFENYTNSKIQVSFLKVRKL